LTDCHLQQMVSFRQTISRLSRLAVFGFQGPRGRQMRRLVVCQWIAVAVFLFLWIKINGGMCVKITPLLFYVNTTATHCW